MHRLTNARSALDYNLKVLTRPNGFAVQDTKFRREWCQEVFCKRLSPWSATLINTHGDLRKTRFNLDVVRWQSTTPSANMQQLMLRKKKKLRPKKFIELLAVTDESTVQTKTPVKKLKAKTLSQFIETAPDSMSVAMRQIMAREEMISEMNSLALEKVDRISHSRLWEEGPIITVGNEQEILNLEKGSKAVDLIMESFQNFKELSSTNSENADFILPADTVIRDEQPHFVEEELETLHEEEHMDTIDIDPVLDQSNPPKKAVTGNFKSRYHNSAELERAAKQKSLAINLSAYLNMCVDTNMLNRGFATILNYRFKYQKTKNTLGIGLYNILLHGYAEKCNLQKIKDIINILEEDNIAFDAQTYAAIFECIGRYPEHSETNKFLQKYQKLAENQQMTLVDVVDKSYFVGDQQDFVLAAIKRLEPGFIPLYTPPKVHYNNKLVNALNADVEPIEAVPKPMMTKDPHKQDVDTEVNFSADELKTFTHEQLQTEISGVLTIQSVEKFPEPTENVHYCRQKITDLQHLWRGQICAAFNRDLNVLRVSAHSKANRSINLFPYLKALDVSVYADILMREVRTLADGSETYSPTVRQLYKELGHRVQTRFKMEQKRKNGILEKTFQIYTEYCSLCKGRDTNDNPRQTWQRLVHSHRNSGPSMNISDGQWPGAVTFGVGRFLYNILMRDLKIDANILRANNRSSNLLPAFYTLFRNQGRLVKEEVKPHPVLSRLYRGSQQHTLVFESSAVPMLCPPQPWSTTVNGGYLLTKSELIRLPQQAVQQLSRIENSPLETMYPCLDSLNQLASVPWRVNTDILDIILEVFNNGGSAKLDVPQHPSELPDPPESTENPDVPQTKIEKFRLFRLKFAHRRRKAEMYSLWCDTLYRLSLANHYRDKVFWLPHNMDFRGRVYPLPPHLNHLGSDLARSLLVFHQKKPLGVDGLSWLKLHCINLTGSKKRVSVRERLLYAETIMDDILDSADNPLNGRMWWVESDEPWQTLTCCIEIAKVMRSPDPTKFESSFPIHQDGSCNGLQHYAALGRDTGGAMSVNLAPSSVPQDVYSGVASLVEKARANDAKNGIEVAAILAGFVQRKVIKQTVMTTVYGVTRYGARLQIARQLKDIDNFPKDWVWPASSYLTAKTFDSLREMFTSTREIQDWFTDCARLISAVCGKNVEWITPLGLPVVQPYHRHERAMLAKNNRISEHISMDQFEKPNIMKQKNAFPPNFIHSLDSSHMMLTSLHCDRAGLTFISVHDCFWTHACTVPEMNKICREQFVALHSEPILEDLSASLLERFSYKDRDLANDGSVMDITKRKLNRSLAQLPEKGDFDLKRVLESIYFFS